MVGNCDVHRLRQLGTTYSLINAERDPEAISEDDRARNVLDEARPHSLAGDAALATDIIVGGWLPDWAGHRHTSPDPAF
jgi:hypothetical protein